ncbi:hypothetical protein BDR26DRAFT_624809 [Obelidium mucronatum]|nr:hypothetical protein BDR26DRAFT_624809 [Obelidium mucronatum]
MHPPILQLLGCDVRDADSYSSYICFVSLWSNNLKEDCSISSKSGAPFEYKQLEKNASSGFSGTASNDTVAPIDDHHATSEPLHSTSHLSSQDTYSVNITEEYQRSFVLLSGASATAAHAQRLKTIDGKYGVFFVFYDLSVRMRGEFRLKFELFDMR